MRIYVINNNVLKKKYIKDLEDTSESDTVYHRSELRRTSLEVPSNPQFIDSVRTSTNMANLFVKVHNLLHNLLKIKKYVTFVLKHLLKGELQNIVILAFI